MGVFDKLLGAVQLNDDSDFSEDNYYNDDEFLEEEDDFEDDLFEDEKPNKKFFEKFNNKKAQKEQSSSSVKKTRETEKVQKDKKNTESPFRKASASREAEKKNTYSRSQSRSTGRSSSKITPIGSGRQKNPSDYVGGEICVIKPTTMDETREIADALVDGCVVILNLESVDVELAQRIIDFSSGSCYALDGRLNKIAGYIFVLTPGGIPVSGDIQNLLHSSMSVAGGY